MITLVFTLDFTDHLNYSVGNWKLVWATLVRQSNVVFDEFQNRFEKRGPTKVGIIEHPPLVCQRT